MATTGATYSYSVRDLQGTDPTLPAVDVLIVVDAETLLLDFPTPTDPSKLDPDKPTQIWTSDPKVLDKYISMFVRQKNIGSTTQVKGSAQLDVIANQNDIIQWRETTFSQNAAYSAILYRYLHAGGDKIFEDASGKSTLGAWIFDRTVPLPNTKDLLHPTMQTIKDYFWQGTVAVEAPKKENYEFAFMLMQKDKTLGYFRWDPTITIKQVT
jgi:nematocidal protein AidA